MSKTASLWHETCEMPRFPKLEGNKKTEVLIIGGGIAGILTAYFMEQQGIDYILVEKDRICHGTTGNTTAKITYQHGLIYDKLLKSGGVEKARGYYLANKAAFDKFAELAANADCGYEIKNNYVYSVNDPLKLEREHKAMDRIGLKAVFVRNVPLPIYTEGAVCVPDQAQFHPLEFLSGIAKGLNIYENSFVIDMANNVVLTDNSRIKAEKIIVTTHFPFINKHGFYYLKLYQNRSYVIALENAQDVGGMYLDENEKGMSFRNYGGLLLVGGGSHRTGKQGGNYRELRRFAKEKYPDSREVYHWAAQDCMSLDDMPYIGRYSLGSIGLYVASGFNKWGMTGSMLSAMMLSDMVLGVKNQFAELFSPSRSVLKPQLFANGFETITSLLTPTAKRCPHLGCALKWNPVEHSWDCSCHGSRFTQNGRVIDNPANGDMKIR